MFDDNSIIHMLRNMQFKWIGGQDLGEKGYTLKVVFPSPSCDIVYGDSFSTWSGYDRHFHIVPIGGQILHISILEKSCCLSYWAWDMPDSRKILYFLTYVVVSGFPQSFNLFISTQIVKYFSHHLRPWPHTLGGICYRSKYLLISSEEKTNMERIQRPKLNLFFPR